MADMTELDDLDRGLIHALQLDGRVPFAVIADVLDTSVQTVTRRYQRLRATAGLRVVGLLDPARGGRQQWLVRLTATAGTAQTIARALARRDDTSWVRLASGGTEIISVVTASPDQANAHALLLHDIPRTSSVTEVSAHYVLHTYLGGPSAWPGRTAALTTDQQARLQPSANCEPPTGPPLPLTAADQRLVEALGDDGRASFTELATAAGISPSTAARRVDALRASDTVFFDVDVDDAALGITTKAMLWMSVAPARLDHAATELSHHAELAFVAATTGRTNLVALALSTDLAALHRYLTTDVAQIHGITNIETAPILTTLKANRTFQR